MGRYDPTKININGHGGTYSDPEQRRLTGWTAHGNFRIDMPFITPIAPNLFHGGVENGLILPGKIKHVLSLYQWEAYTVKHELLSSKTVEMYDSLDQGFEQIEELALWVNEARKSGPVLVHCQAGLNRSSLVVAKALLLSGEAETGREAIDMIRAARSEACLCNLAFASWVSAQ
jgi:protein-tyrosine phosphatase